MSTNNEQRESSNHDSDKIALLSDKWFYMCEIDDIIVNENDNVPK